MTLARSKAVLLPCLLASLVPSCADRAVMNQSRPAASIHRVRSAADLKSRMADGSFVVVHTLAKKDYVREHIPGSVHISYKDVSAATLNRPKDTPIVFYCAGGGCPVSRMAADRAIDAGYTNIYIFEGGLQDWKAAGFDIAVGE